MASVVAKPAPALPPTKTWMYAERTSTDEQMPAFTGRAGKMAATASTATPLNADVQPEEMDIDPEVCQLTLAIKLLCQIIIVFLICHQCVLVNFVLSDAT